MRVVITGATGNVGTSVVDALMGDPAVESVVGLARRAPRPQDRAGGGRLQWAEADVVTDDLASRFAGADVVVHLAWAIQPSHRARSLRATNVEGSRRVLAAVAAARVPALVYASSVGTYSPGPKDRAVDESWPTGGVRSSSYARHKSDVEALLDGFEVAHPGVRVVRLRPGLVGKREAAEGIRRLFVGPLLPPQLLRPSRIPVVPDVAGLVFQVVHSHDVGEAFRLAVVGNAAGPFNLAADPVLHPAELARVLGARLVPLPARVLRAGADIAWRLRLQPTAPGWVDLILNVPVMDTGRARRELGWAPRISSTEVLTELLEGLADRAFRATPALARGLGWTRPRQAPAQPAPAAAAAGPAARSGALARR